MHIRELVLQNFTSYKEAVVKFPDTGLVLVTGDNGSGKSSLVEAISWGVWGKTIRGTDPVAPETTCLVEVKTDLFAAKRTKKSGGRAAFRWSDSAGKETDWESNTEAKKALEEIASDLGLWQKTAVFSSSDAANFTLATDGERKRLLESILGLEKFDAALSICRADIKAKKVSISSLEKELAVYEERLANNLTRLADTKDSISSIGDEYSEAAAQESMDRITPMIEEYDADISRVSDLSKELRDLLSIARANLETAKRKEHIANSKQCPECEQGIGAKVAGDIKSRIIEAEKKLDRELNINGEKLTDCELELASLRQERLVAAQQLSVFKERLSAMQKYRAEKDRLGVLYQEINTSIGEIDSIIDSKTVELYLVSEKLSLLSTCAAVLGLRGVRAQVISNALGGLEDAANMWLQRISGDGLSVCIKPYSKNSNGVSDSISLDVIGAGGGFGYRAASGGERRRLDVAILLALSEIASTSTDAELGTLFFDEVFDALDPDGIAAIVGVLKELSKTRTVVVITHSDDLISSVDADFRWHVSNGSIQAI